MTNTVLFHRSSLAARASSLVARNWAPAAGMAGGCSSAAEVDPMNDTSGSMPLAQSSSKPSSGLLAGVGLAGSPIPPGVPLPHSVPFDRHGVVEGRGHQPGGLELLEVGAVMVLCGQPLFW